MTAGIGKVLTTTMFGLLMVAAAAGGGGRGSDGAAALVSVVSVVSVASVVAVIASVWWRRAATGAVLASVITVVLATPDPMCTVLAGLAATAYLVLRHSDPTVPSMSFAVGFAAVGAVAVLVPVQIAWLPLVAPVALFTAYLLALQPLLPRTR
ncbi:hypothetical protein ACNUDN_01220 [Mycobacterium sp. smrl_JER01]|uniref:hypothetical protein n=1 Tax=Mycobacterium sp. smrl_JER01 TaxID=3402633 RepID=UPI003AD7E576